MGKFPTVIIKQPDFEEKPDFYIESGRGFLSERQARERPQDNRKRIRYRVGAPREVYRNGQNQWVHPVSAPEIIEGDEETCIIVGGQELTMSDLSELSQELAEKRAKRRAERAQKRASPHEISAALKEMAAMKLARAKGRRHFGMIHTAENIPSHVIAAMAEVAKEGAGLA